MKLGTHNSLSYCKPQWYFRLFNFIGKCQDLNIYEQYEAGVRYYDIRVKFKKDKIVSGHGLLTYNINVEDVLDFLNDQATCNVRIVLETNLFSSDAAATTTPPGHMQNEYIPLPKLLL